MCGLAGVIGRDPTGIEVAVRRMMRLMVHRGPDDEGFVQKRLAAEADGPTVGFGFRRLSILDLSSGGHQPIVNVQTGDVLVFNGEIYNYVELRERLEAKGHAFRSSSDTEVLLKALAEWGEAALGELDGMFGLAFYEAATRRVLLARDPLGIKPLYVARLPGVVVFASEVRAVIGSGLVPGELDQAGIATYLAYGAPQDPLTVHRFIKSLPAGTMEWIGIGQLQGERPAARRYWRLPAIDPEAPTAIAVSKTQQLLADSVRLQSVADVPVGVFLSAGIDSATVAAMAQPRNGAVHTFSVGFESRMQQDETVAAAATAAALGTRHFQTILDEQWAVGQFIEWLKAADRPSIDGFNTYIVSGAVKDSGITVALSGLGADEIFGGYGIFARATRLKRLMQPLAWVSRRLRRAAAGVVFSVLPPLRRAKAVEMVAHGDSPADLAIWSRRLLLDDQLAALGLHAGSLGLTDHYLPPEACRAFEAVGDPFHDVSQAEISLYMGNTLLRDSDVNSMAHSLELRVPFLGRQLIDYVCSLPAAVRAPPRSQPKYLLRAAMRDCLPLEIFSRPKTGFTLPVDEWLDGELRGLCEAAVEQLATCSIVEPAAVRSLWNNFQGKRTPGLLSRRMALVALGHYVRSVSLL